MNGIPPQSSEGSTRELAKSQSGNKHKLYGQRTATPSSVITLINHQNVPPEYNSLSDALTEEKELIWTGSSEVDYIPNWFGLIWFRSILSEHYNTIPTRRCSPAAAEASSLPVMNIDL